MRLRLLLLAGLVVGFLAVAPAPAIACSCASASVASYVHHADSVGTGRVLWMTEGAHETTFAVDFTDVYQGSLGSREKVLTAGTGGGCGLDTLEVGREYVFFVEGSHRGRISASLCGGTTEATAPLLRRVESVTGPPYAPVHVDASLITEPTHRAWRWVGYAALVALLAGGTAWLVDRRRHPSGRST